MRRTLPPAVMAVLLHDEQPPAAPAPAAAPLDFEGAEAAEMQPVGDPETRSWETPSTALVYVTECPGSALVIVDDGQLHLERWREDICCGTEACYVDVVGNDPSAVPWGLAIWVGKMHTTETNTPDGHEFDTDMRGSLRALTDVEWRALREFGAPWGRSPSTPALPFVPAIEAPHRYSAGELPMVGDVVTWGETRLTVRNLDADGDPIFDRGMCRFASVCTLVRRADPEVK